MAVAFFGILPSFFLLWLTAFESDLGNIAGVRDSFMSLGGNITCIAMTESISAAGCCLASVFDTRMFWNNDLLAISSVTVP
jgi:hypothetical protein